MKYVVFCFPHKNRSVVSFIPSPSQQMHTFKCQYPEVRANACKHGSVCEQHCW